MLKQLNKIDIFKLIKQRATRLYDNDTAHYITTMARDFLSKRHSDMHAIVLSGLKNSDLITYKCFMLLK